MLRGKRDHTAARAFFERAIGLHGVPDKITIDKSGANTAAIVSMQADSGLPIEMRQSKHLNNIVEQDHCAVKRITRPMPGFKSFRCARILITGIELMHMIRKGQLGESKIEPRLHPNASARWLSDQRRPCRNAWSHLAIATEPRVRGIKIDLLY